MASQALDNKFWNKFAKNYWEKKPLVVKGIKSDLLALDQSEVFKLLVAASDQSRKDKTPLGFKFYVDGIRSSDIETMHILPKKSDRTLLGYHERMERIYQDYCLVCDELMQVNHDKQALLNQFTKQLYKHVGFTNRFAEMGLYLGNYRKTPFGVHVDNCGVFSFPVIGTKKFRIWSSAYAKKHPDLEQSFQYAKHKSKSLLLTAGKSDMAYWPSSAWHIAESNGNFSATWSLGVWVDRPVKQNISEAVLKLLTEKIGDQLDSTAIDINHLETRDGELAKLPKIFEQTIDAIKNLSPDELKNLFKRDLLKHLSSHGMKSLPQNKAPFKFGPTVKLKHQSEPILWTKEKSGFIFSFAGNSPRFSKSKSLLKLIKDLNRGETCVPKNYAFGTAERAAIVTLGKTGALS